MKLELEGKEPLWIILGIPALVAMVLWLLLVATLKVKEATEDPTERARGSAEGFTHLPEELYPVRLQLQVEALPAVLTVTPEVAPCEMAVRALTVPADIPVVLKPEAVVPVKVPLSVEAAQPEPLVFKVKTEMPGDLLPPPADIKQP